MNFRLSLAQFFLALLLLISNGFVFGSQDLSVADEELFKQGVQAFNQGQYQHALPLFLQLEAQMQPDNRQDLELQYNLGATYYKLKRYRKARGYFISLLGTGYNDLAHYNLALIAYRLEDFKQSLQQLEAIQQSQNTNLRLLARALLTKVRRHSRPEQAIAFRAYSGNLKYTIGYDSNVSLVNEDLAGSQRLSDLQHTFKLNGSYLLYGDWKQGLNVHADYFDQRHRSESDFDYAILRAGLDFHKDLDSLYSRYRLRLAQSEFAAQPYQRLSELQALYVLPYQSRQSLSLSLYAFDISSLASAYEHLEGQRYRGRVSWLNSGTPWRQTLAYTYENNHRRDYEALVNNIIDFRSQSPVRHEFRYSFSRRFSEKITWRNHLYFRLSLYPDANTNIAPKLKREDERYRLLSILHWDFIGNWSAMAQYQFTENQSNIDQYSYDGHNFALGLEMKF